MSGCRNGRGAAERFVTSRSGHDILGGVWSKWASDTVRLYLDAGGLRFEVQPRQFASVFFSRISRGKVLAGRDTGSGGGLQWLGELHHRRRVDRSVSVLSCVLCTYFYFYYFVY